jgi:hypothetical protein
MKPLKTVEVRPRHNALAYKVSTSKQDTNTGMPCLRAYFGHRRTAFHERLWSALFVVAAYWPREHAQQFICTGDLFRRSCLLTVTK